MNFTIHDILENIRNDGFWERCEQSYYEHLKNYRLKQNNVKNFEECNELMNDFMTHYFRKGEVKNIDADSRHVFGNVARENFERLYKDNYMLMLNKQMIGGADGGVYKLLKQLMHLMIEDSVSWHIKGKVTEYINDLELEEKIELANQYIDNFSEYLPQSLSNAPVLIAVKLEEVILEHIKTEKKIGGSIA